MKTKLGIILFAMLAIVTNVSAGDYYLMFQDTIPPVKEQEVVEEPEEEELEEWEEEDNSEESSKRSGTKSFVNFDFGLNNYTENGKFPDASNAIYTVKPFGSWYIGIASINKTKIAGPLYLEWGAGVSWYNFKFEDAMARLVKDANGVTFEQDQNNFDSYKKSKLTVSYLNISLIPMIHTDSKAIKGWFWESSGKQGFRFGAGPYAGYRVGSKQKTVFDNGAKQKDKNKDNFFLTNLRYGWRAQVGWKGTDLFFNYDMNTLFEEGKGPELSPFSFGIIF